MKVQGYDILGAYHRKFPMRLIGKFTKENVKGVGFLDDSTFGDRKEGIKKIEAYIRAHSLTLARVHLLNGTAVRNNKLPPTELLRGYTIKTLDEAARDRKSKLYELIKRGLDNVSRLENITGLKLFVSGILEHDLSGEGALAVASFIIEQGFYAVDNPMNRNYPKIGSSLYESHGNNKSGLNIISHDGIEASDVNYYVTDNSEDGRADTNYQDAADIFESYWINTFNLRFTGLKEWINPRDRIVIPDEEEMRYLLRIMAPAQPVPDTGGFRPLKAPEIWKPRAEDYKSGDNREGQPCLIVNKNYGTFINVLDLEKRMIGRLKYYGPFGNKQSRYYLGSTGGKVQDLFKRNKGREWVLLQANGFSARVNLFRRSGVDR